MYELPIAGSEPVLGFRAGLHLNPPNKPTFFEDTHEELIPRSPKAVGFRVSK